MKSIAVVGGGIIGLSCAWRLAQAGHPVQLWDDSPGQGASWAAAGMLAPVSELAPGEQALLRAGLASAAAWPGFASELEQTSGCEVDLDQGGSLLVGQNADDARLLRHHGQLLESYGLAAQSLSSKETRALEPALSPRITSGLWVASDHSVNPRRVLQALLQALDRAGVQRHPHRAQVHRRDGRVTGVRDPQGQLWPTDLVLLSAGYESGASLTGLGSAVRPVKGQILRLAGAQGLLQRTIRAASCGVSVYFVPRRDGELIVGATMEDVGADHRVTAGGVQQLLRAALEVLPEVAELELVETMARFRPTLPDNGPLIDLAEPGLLVATGHYRGGVLLAPSTASAVVELAADRPLDPLIHPFSSTRHT